MNKIIVISNIKWIHQNHPGQIVVPLNVDSTQGMAMQVYQVYQAINSLVSNNASFDGGYHLIGHAQGALVLRSVVEMFGLEVDNFISLAGVHMGVYGFDSFINRWFKDLTNWEITEMLYTKNMQTHFSVAGWWNDAKNQPKYFRDNTWLPAINQQLDEHIPTYKENFLNIGAFHAFGSQDDGTVIPWQSSIFGFYDEHLNVVPMTDQLIYINDTFGLQTLATNSRLSLIEIDDVKHYEWFTRQDIFVNYILDLLS
ncbi:palmitoyl-protein thioesterase 2 [Heterostelium album PN500]|uniref:Palmitoyl-protein thioesterase 2 n=1 Tax=Heterostelium pallidum (strain ATCC 26659 / Pp 5 / PN500) TaxID=670386 RepID=D3BM26_HETP5|nr:palmitoyl-protein thioesterase 2 [Heterostelium album PN500]EFA77627.1 palmitoyl-protein thioesterase 2 [Heterostelium album PN500]|eukprot:XP_020429755.1 palmitoyl-protein thioesterase 2 [Heterostelium album PN500]